MAKRKQKPTTAVVVAQPTAIDATPLGEVEEPAEAQTPAERVNYHVAMGQRHGRLALAHLLAAGWELARQKQSIGWGGWAAWCDKSLTVTQRTAENYINFYHQTIGARRAESQIPLEKRLTHRELEEATVGMEGKSATRAMVDLGIIKRAGWGGLRPDAGRKPKDAGKSVAAALEEAAGLEPVLWAAAKGALDTLVQLDASRDYLHRLSDEHLAIVTQTLALLSQLAAKVFAVRTGGQPPAPYQIKVPTF